MSTLMGKGIGTYTYMKSSSKYSNVVVISQPMYFPWVGFISQLAMADTIIWLDDVKFSKGSFTNRVQILDNGKSSWLSLSLEGKGTNRLIKDLKISSNDIERRHRDKIKNCFKSSPYFDEVIKTFDKTWEKPDCASEIIIRSAEVICSRIGICLPKQLRSSSLNVSLTGSARVQKLVELVGGDMYLTGNGAKGYLDHNSFNKANIDVFYMVYESKAWPQASREFTPYVTSLDLIANVGPEHRETHLSRQYTYWENVV